MRPAICTSQEITASWPTSRCLLPSLACGRSCTLPSLAAGRSLHSTIRIPRKFWSPSMHTNPREGRDAGRPDGQDKVPVRDRNDENPGYEVQDVNVGGVITFLAGLCGFLLIFF